MTLLRALAPGKLNVCLFLGPVREDGRHELVTVMDSLSLADELTLGPGDGPRDEVVCPGVEGDNLAARALAAFRTQTGLAGPPWWRLTIDKRVPVAAGMGGGSGDAAAALRLALAAAADPRLVGAQAVPGRRPAGSPAAAPPLDEDALVALAAQLGADVPGQVRPGRVLATGAGERLHRLPDPRPYGVLVLPSHERLSTPAVYAEADRLGLQRDAAWLTAARDAVQRALESGPPTPPLPPPELLVNDLEPAARSLCPSIDAALAAARDAGARHAMVSGSGPTVVGLFDDPDAAARAAKRLAGRDPAPIAASPVGAEYGAVR
jgi:4-diphosphocytidyl-2-C-methyl-D-erythritol kinase